MSRFGYDTTAEEIARSHDLRGMRAVLTGASSGIGVETARALALAGADVVLGVRDVAKGEAVVHDLATTANGEMRVLDLDLRDLDSVTAFADRITGAVDLLIANAGVSKTPDAHLPNGLDVRFATNHLGHFLLAVRLREQMVVRGARIVLVSSAAHKGMPVQLDDLQWHARSIRRAWPTRSRRVPTSCSRQEATRRWGADGIFANAVLPGSALTGLQRFHGDELKRQIGFILPDGTLNPILKTAAQAAATTLWACTAPELEGRGGLVLEDCAEALPVGPETHPWSGFDERVADPDTARRLWDHSVDLLRTLGVDP